MNLLAPLDPHRLARIRLEADALGARETLGPLSPRLQEPPLEAELEQTVVGADEHREVPLLARVSVQAQILLHLEYLHGAAVALPHGEGGAEVLPAHRGGGPGCRPEIVAFRWIFT